MSEREHRRTQDEIDEEEWQKKGNWVWGLFYYSETDSRAWVPKRSFFGRRRWGGTPNFAKPSARQHMMIILGILLLIFLVVVSLERSGILP